MKIRNIILLASASVFILMPSCKKYTYPLASGDSETIAFAPVLDNGTEQTKGSMITGTTYNYGTLGPFWVKVWNKNASTADFGYSKVMQFTHTTGSLHTYWSTVDDTDKIVEHYWKKSGSSPETKYFYAYTNLPAAGVTVKSDHWSNQDMQYNAYQISTAAAQKDVLLGLGHGQGYTKEGYVGRFVQITFIHPLAAVKFKKGNIEGWTTGDKITEIKISGVWSSANFYNNDSSSSWRNQSSSTTVTMTDAEGLAIDSSNNIGDTFFIIPQNLAAKNVTIMASAVIGGMTFTNISCNVSAGEWKAGKYYTYTLDFAAGLDPVLNVTLADWGNIDEDVDIDPGNVTTFTPVVDAWDNQDKGNISYSDR